MKLQPDRSDAQIISAYGPGWIGVGGERITHSVIVTSRGDRIAWGPGRFEDLEAAHFEPLAQMRVEVVIFGSGGRIRFPRSSWLQALMSSRVGLETMDTPAACRTSHLLAQEGRDVAAALLIGELD